MLIENSCNYVTQHRPFCHGRDDSFRRPGCCSFIRKHGLTFGPTSNIMMQREKRWGFFWYCSITAAKVQG